MTDDLPDPNQQTVSQQTPPPWPVPQQTHPTWSGAFPPQSPPTPPSFPAQLPPTPPALPRLSPPPPLPSAQQTPLTDPPRWPRPGRQRKNTALIVTAVVFFVAAALSGTLYVLADRDHDAAVARLAEQREDLTTAREQVDSTAAQVSAEEEDNTALSDENAALSACVDAVQHYLWDGLVDPERSAALTRMFDLCQ
jgi:hypothetical protein